MASEDIKLINRHLEVLHDELLDLTKAVENRAELERSAAMLEVYEAFQPVLRAFVRHEAEAGAIGGEPNEVVKALEEALPQLGLRPTGTPGQVLEIWPEQAQRDFELDRSVADDATLVRVEVLSRGWFRGKKVIARPIGRVLEVIDDEKDE